MPPSTIDQNRINFNGDEHPASGVPDIESPGLNAPGTGATDDYPKNSVSETPGERLVRGALFALALTLPVLVGIAFDAYELVSACSFGAMFALFVAPRHGARTRILGVAAAGFLVVAAAALGIQLQGQHNFVLILLFLLSWLAALPRPDQAYLGLVVKYAAAAVLLTSFGFSATFPFALSFIVGLGLGTLLSLAAMLYEGDKGGSSPSEEFKALLRGAANDRMFGIAVPITVLLSTVVAQRCEFNDPAWVGLTVLFVMHADGGTELARIRDRALGTILGVGAAAVILFSAQDPLLIAAAVAVSAFVMPFSVKNHFLVFSLVITCAVMLLIDISLFRHGGDIPLLRWRLIDAVTGCLWVLASNIILRGIRRFRYAGSPTSTSANKKAPNSI